MANQSAGAFVRAAVTTTTRFYMGSLMSFLVHSAETENNFCFLEFRSKQGHEPPPHIHIDQDEVFYLLEGELELYCKSQIMTARAGQAVFLPRNQAHAFYFISPCIRLLILTQPGGLDDYFEAMSSPATSMMPPADEMSYAQADPARAIAVAHRYGIKILTPEETAELLPHYPGFAVRR